MAEQQWYDTDKYRQAFNALPEECKNLDSLHNFIQIVYQLGWDDRGKVIIT